ncbi:MAG: energy transducer TonB [Prevotella sp.]|nr:energy transducer TonB [Candidatus Prevotella equi]
MEVKKSYKADLEHRRPIVFAVALVATAVLFVGILFIPFKSISDLTEEFFDDYAMDLDLKANEQDDMISAALPQPEVEQKENNILNKVDEMTELAPEQLDNTTPQQEEETKEEEKEEEQTPINLNGDDEEALRIVEQLPEYPGGMVEFMKWLTATLKYPDVALKQHIQGKVMISFIVNKDGSLSDIKLVKGVNRLLDAEALRVAKLMPKWTPGKEKGQPCRTMIAIPIVFEI